MDANLDDILTHAQAMLERRAAGLAICQPKALAQQDIRPEVDTAAISFFQKFKQKRKEIQSADELEAIKITMSCCNSWGDFWTFYRTTDDPRQEFIAFQEANKISEELSAMRTARKTVRWIETSGLLQGAAYDG